MLEEATVFSKQKGLCTEGQEATARPETSLHSPVPRTACDPSPSPAASQGIKELENCVGNARGMTRHEGSQAFMDLLPS